ncbi:transcriptional regulator [Fulvivirgaceae bacterium BMA12]|uniref:Transcriptional regulator n=1 Tax=Agaribacillus aureus TaxID=3051825 RepID=A0ABT8L0C5_9BACT|nr:transcriptional regulator [Fulvivirgaceae bacterium BMA12]
MMTSVITGDIINSRKVLDGAWLATLKAALNRYGQEPASWEIYRGDSFQLEVTPSEALKAALLVKANIKQYKQLDARMAIGIGEKSFPATKITESNGSAFVNSGECFEGLKKRTLAIRSPWPEIDRELNLYFDLALLTMDLWTGNASTILKTAMEHPELTQQALAEKLKKTQSVISESLKRAGYEEIMRMEKRYKELISNQ